MKREGRVGCEGRVGNEVKVVRDGMVCSESEIRRVG